jgi:hypothetical protein
VRCRVRYAALLDRLVLRVHLICGMGNTWIVDLRHYMTPAGTVADLPPRAGTLAQYWTQIVAQGSNFDQPITLRCRRKPRRRLCEGMLEISLDQDLDGIVWRCPICEDNGAITGWQRTFWDNSDIPDTSDLTQ